MLHNIHSCKWCWVVKKGNRIRRLMSIMSNRFFLEQVRVSKWHKCIYFPQAICALCEPLLCCCFACYFSCSNKDKKVLARAKGLIHLVSDEGFGASCQLEIQLLLFEEEIISVTSILVICSALWTGSKLDPTAMLSRRGYYRKGAAWPLYRSYIVPP